MQCIKLPVFFVGGGVLSPTPTSFPTESPNVYYPCTCVHSNLPTLDGPSMRVDTVNFEHCVFRHCISGKTSCGWSLMEAHSPNMLESGSYAGTLPESHICGIVSCKSMAVFKWN